MIDTCHQCYLCLSYPVQWPSHPGNKTWIKKSGEVASIIVRNIPSLSNTKPVLPSQLLLAFPLRCGHLLHHLWPLQHLDFCLHQTQRALLLPIRIIICLHRRVAFEVDQCPVSCQPPPIHLYLHQTHPFVSPIVRSLPGPSAANDATRNQDV